MALIPPKAWLGTSSVGLEQPAAGVARNWEASLSLKVQGPK